MVLLLKSRPQSEVECKGQNYSQYNKFSLIYTASYINTIWHIHHNILYYEQAAFESFVCARSCLNSIYVYIEVICSLEEPKASWGTEVGIRKVMIVTELLEMLWLPDSGMGFSLCLCIYHLFIQICI